MDPEDDCGTEQLRPHKYKEAQSKGCCAMRQTAEGRLRQLIEGKRQQLAGLEKLLKVAEFANDDPAFEQVLYSAVSNIRNDGPFGL